MALMPWPELNRGGWFGPDPIPGEFLPDFSRARTDWDILAGIIRYYTLLPYIRERRGLEHLQRVLLLAETLDPEARARFLNEQLGPIVERYGLKGVPTSVAVPTTLTLNELKKVDPERAAQIEEALGSAVLANIPEGAGEPYTSQIKARILQSVGVLPITVWRRPDGSIHVDPRSLAEAQERAWRMVTETARGVQVTLSGREYLTRTDPNKVSLLDSIGPQGQILLQAQVDLRNPNPFLTTVGETLTRQEGRLIERLNTNLDLFLKAPTMANFTRVSKQLEAMEPMLDQLSPGAKEVYRTALQAIRESRVEVRIPGSPQPVLMDPVQAMQFRNQLTQDFITRAKPVVEVYERNPTPENAKKVNALVAEATQYGIDIRTVVDAIRYSVRDELTRQKLERDLSNVQLERARLELDTARQMRPLQIAEARTRLQAAREEAEMTRTKRQILTRILNGTASELEYAVYGLTTLERLDNRQYLDLMKQTSESVGGAWEELRNAFTSGKRNLNAEAKRYVDSLALSAEVELEPFAPSAPGVRKGSGLAQGIARSSFANTIATLDPANGNHRVLVEAVRQGRLDRSVLEDYKEKMRTVIQRARTYGLIDERSYGMLRRWVDIIDAPGYWPAEQRSGFLQRVSDWIRRYVVSFGRTPSGEPIPVSP